MKAVIQRVNYSKLKIGGEVYSEIEKGLMILLGITHNDTINDIRWLSNKIINLRIFNDDDGIMNYSVKDINGDIQVVSQFTLHAQTKKGNRPSYIAAAKGEFAENYYNLFVDEMTNIFNKKKPLKISKNLNLELKLEFEKINKLLVKTSMTFLAGLKVLN